MQVLICGVLIDLRNFFLLWHFSQQVLSWKLEFVVATNIWCYHGNNGLRTLIKGVLEHPPWRSICMPNLRGGQKFSFLTSFDFYREVFLSIEVFGIAA